MYWTLVVLNNMELSQFKCNMSSLYFCKFKEINIRGIPFTQTPSESVVKHTFLNVRYHMHFFFYNKLHLVYMFKKITIL